MPLFMTKGLYAIALAICVGFSGLQLILHLNWSGYASLTAEITQGRAETGDLVLLAPVLERAGPESCDVLSDTPVVTLHLYANDLFARQAGVSPFLPADDPALSAQRIATRDLVEDALACTPLDGNLWLSLAILSRAMGNAPEPTTRFVDLSKRYAPHEGWVAGRRERLFRGAATGLN